MKKLTPITLALALSSHATFVNAESWIGLDLGLGSSDYTSASDDIDTSAHVALTFGYELSPSWGTSVTLLTGSGSSIARENIGEATEADEELDYSAISFNAHRYFTLTKNQSLFVSLGINYNQTKVELLDTTPIDDSGAGYTISAGWEYDFGQWRLRAGAQRLGLSSVDVNTATLGAIIEF